MPWYGAPAEISYEDKAERAADERWSTLEEIFSDFSAEHSLKDLLTHDFCAKDGSFGGHKMEPEELGLYIMGKWDEYRGDA